jgi:GNAT superfamily N-acetyltransferase
MDLHVRPAALPHDYAEIAHVLTAENPEWPTTVEALQHADAARDPQLHRAVFVAEDASAAHKPLVGVASVGHDLMAHRPGKFKLDIRVPPELQGRGIGAALYRTLLTHLEPLQPRELQTDVWETLERAVRFVSDRGFVEAWRRIDSRLEVRQFDAGPYADLEARLRALGIVIKTYAELEAHPRRLDKLSELDWALWQDVPYGEAVTPKSREHFEKETVHNPDFIPEACFIALRGDEFVGYSYLTSGDGFFLCELTGVRRGHRGQGLATLLKLRGIRYAQDHGQWEIRTVNDSVNTAVLALNARLGFQRDGATIRFVKHVEKTKRRDYVSPSR